MRSFRDETVLITGAASGIGKAAAQAFAQRGARLVLTDIQDELLEATATQIAATGAQVQHHHLDVTDAEAFQRRVDAVVEEHGKIDIAFLNAGIAIIGEVKDLGLEAWSRTLDVNVRGVVHGVAAVYPQMVQQGFGHIVNTASLAGLVPTGFFVPYVASKHAVVGLSTSLRIEARAYGVGVSALCPGFVRTPLVTDAEIPTLTEEGRQLLLDKLPGMIAPEQCAAALLKGIQKNKAIITTPLLARLAWSIHRFSPGLIRLFGRLNVQKMRKYKQS